MTPDRPVYRLHLDPIRISNGRMLVTDWQGKIHSFRDHAKGLAFAAKLYARKPKAIQAAKREAPARWSNPPQSIVWHYERHAFTQGKAVIAR